MIAANAVFISDQKMDLSSHGIDCISFNEAPSYLARNHPSVIGTQSQMQNFAQVKNLLEQEKNKNTHKRFLIVNTDLDAEHLVQLHNSLKNMWVIEQNTAQPLHTFFEQALDQFYELEQGKKLVELVNEKNDELKRLMLQLEEKVESRQQLLESTKQKNTRARQRLELLKKTLVQIYPATSIHEIEHGISETLKKEFSISWVSIRLASQSNLSEKKDEIKFFQVPLKLDQKDFGHLLFFKEKNEPFDSKEKRFLTQVAEAASMSIERIFQYEKSQELKRQWETTFDAISDPICLTDIDFNILRVNAQFLKKIRATHEREPIGQKCYESLFQRSQPCEGCDRGKAFKIRNIKNNKSSDVYEVYSNNLGSTDQAVFFQMYRDITQDLNLQRQVIESAKMAELGTISSSIAHELNNPIGGMLNFVQLMKMDLTSEENYYSDILEIEKGIFKCKNIVKNLLGFSRKSFHADLASVNLNEVIEQAIKITELKTRSIGITIKYQPPTEDFILPGRYNLLTHAVRNILQNSEESLIEKRKNQKKFSGQIDITLESNSEQFIIGICDNGDPIDEKDRYRIFDPLYTTKDPETNSGLGLTLALQIVKEHNGHIEVTISKDKKMCVQLIFSKPQGQSGLSTF